MPSDYRILFACGLLAACSTATEPDPSQPGPGPIHHPDAGAPGSIDASAPPSADAGAPGSIDAGAPPSPDAGAPQGTATIRVHYPAGTHHVTLRGGTSPLSWSVGANMNGASDTFTYTLSGLTGPIEWKPLLDDSSWALGPNYHVRPGETIDIYPRFSSSAGRVTTLIASFHSTLLNNSRAIYAYLPAGYDENTTARYPVVYMHDGQNLWAAMPQLAAFGTWNVDTAFDNAAGHGVCSANGTTGWGAAPLGGSATTCNGDGDCGTGGDCRTFPEAIVIGVANTAGRISEYTPTPDPSYPSGGGGDQYLKFLVTELKPQIDQMLRTRTDRASTALVGSSLGGLISSYGGLKYPDVFGAIGAISPSTWWNNDVLLSEIATTAAAPNRPLIVYVDSGSGTADDEADTDMLVTTYQNLGYQNGVNFRHVVQNGAQHSETYWAQRLPGALQLLLGSR